MILAAATKPLCAPAGIACVPARRAATLPRIGFALLLGCLDAVAAHAGSIAGRVRFEGTPPARPNITMSVDSTCDRLFPKGRPGEEVIVDHGAGLANVIVYVKSGLPEDYVPPPPAASAGIDQKGCAYVPHVLGVRAGQEIAIHNGDATMHNVNARAVANAPFSEAMPGKDLVIRKSFAREEVAVKLKCDVHPWMTAYIGVFAHPFFAVTAADGTFTIAGLPEGEYHVEAWHESLGVRSARLELDEEDSTKLDFSFAGNQAP